MDMIPQDDTPRKQCTGECKQFLPATPEFFYVDKGRLIAVCKACKKAYQKAHGKAHAKEIYQSRHTYREAHKEEMRVYKQQYYQAHKDEQRERERIRRATHREQIRIRRRRYQQETHREQYRQYHNLYYRTHKEQASEQGRKRYESYKEQIQEQVKRYSRTERGRMVHRAHNHKREVQKRAIESSLTAQQIESKLKGQRNACYYCSAKFEKKDGKYIFHVEHTIPLSRAEHNPRHDVNYVVLACPVCNLKKGARLPHEFFEGGRLL